MATVYIQKERVNHINLTNGTGADLAQYEFTVLGKRCLIADEAIVDGAVGSFHNEDNLLIQVADLKSTEDTFATANAPVYWDSATGEFSDTSTAGYFEIGIVHTVKDSNGMVLVTLNAKAVEI